MIFFLYMFRYLYSTITDCITLHIKAQESNHSIIYEIK